jgi:hypothetical protein
MVFGLLHGLRYLIFFPNTLIEDMASFLRIEESAAFLTHGLPSHWILTKIFDTTDPGMSN